MEKIGFDDFVKLDLRIGEIKSVENHPNADKLLVMKVDLGSEIGERTICAGLKEYYSKEYLVGKKAVFIVNLEPRTIRGVESNGMILAAGSKEEGKFVFLKPKIVVNVGEKVGFKHG